MTLQELYLSIDGDYDQVMRVLRMEKLVDKHIRKFAKNGVVERLLEAGKTKDPTQMFEAAHAMKGVCGNLGLTSLSKKASELTEEFRPGKPRTLSDSEVAAKVEALKAQYDRTIEAIRAFQKEG
jgi:HPt (histidine-containing phosphotransfer) domain-containing protein